VRSRAVRIAGGTVIAALVLLLAIKAIATAHHRYIVRDLCRAKFPLHTSYSEISARGEVRNFIPSKMKSGEMRAATWGDPPDHLTCVVKFEQGHVVDWMIVSGD